MVYELHLMVIKILKMDQLISKSEYNYNVMLVLFSPLVPIQSLCYHLDIVSIF